jgi:hypothetical protein
MMRNKAHSKIWEGSDISADLAQMLQYLHALLPVTTIKHLTALLAA